MTKRKLTDADIVDIRASKDTNAELARRYNVSDTTIQRHRPQRPTRQQWSDAKDAYLPRLENEERRLQEIEGEQRRLQRLERLMNAKEQLRAAHAEELAKPLISPDLLSNHERQAIRANVSGRQRWRSLGGFTP